jgi:hypothetical protein
MLRALLAAIPEQPLEVTLQAERERSGVLE